MEKILLIDGLSTIMNEKYFILDEVPRILADYIDDKFKIWIAIRYHEETSQWSDDRIVPKWLHDNVKVIEALDFQKLPNVADQNESIVITNDLNNTSIYNVCGDVFHIEEVFRYGTFPTVDIADFIFCFGFDEETFINFCVQSNLIGVVNNKTVRDNDPKNSVNGMAFWVDKDKKWNETLEECSVFANICIKKNRFKPKYDRSILGVMNQNKTDTLAIESNLPILYV